MKHIAIIVADEGNNLELAKTIQTALGSTPTTLINLIDLNLPQYTYQYEAEHGISEKVSEFTETLENATGFVVVSPEYNGTMPPILTSAIAWATRAKQNWREVFNEKPTGIASYSYTGATNLFISLRIHLSYIGMNVLARPIPATPDKPALDDDIKAIVNQLLL